MNTIDYYNENAQSFIDGTVSVEFTSVQKVFLELLSNMDCFICKIRSGNLILKEHEAAKWLTKETLDSVGWLPADLGLIEKIEKCL